MKLKDANVARNPCACGNLVACTCSIAREHAKGCRYLRAATLSFELACRHGYQACPTCDPCTCSPPPIVTFGVR